MDLNNLILSSLIICTLSVVSNGQDIIELGTHPQTGMEEIRVILPNLPEGALPLDMVKIPEGYYMQARPNYEFYISKYEFTMGQWVAITGSNPWRELYEQQGKNPDESKIPFGHNYPVYEIDWENAVYTTYALNIKFKAANDFYRGHFRLPLESEWEAACRAGTATQFSFGNALFNEPHPDDDDITILTISEESGYQDYVWCKETAENQIRICAPVALKKPNAWGIYDMHGNVAEWCVNLPKKLTKYSYIDDRYVHDGFMWEIVQTIPRKMLIFATLRGGSAFEPLKRCNAAIREHVPYGKMEIGHGFRLVWSRYHPYRSSTLEQGGNIFIQGIIDNINRMRQRYLAPPQLQETTPEIYIEEPKEIDIPQDISTMGLIFENVNRLIKEPEKP